MTRSTTFEKVLKTNGVTKSNVKQVINKQLKNAIK